MPSDNVELIRRAHEAYSRDDLETMLGFVDPKVEWTYLDPNLPEPKPQVCRGRQEVESLLREWAEHGLKAELEEVAGAGERVMVGSRDSGPPSGGPERTRPTSCSRSDVAGSLSCVTAGTVGMPSK